MVFRVKNYEVIVVYLKDLKAVTRIYSFLKEHFKEAGAEYSEEGMPLELAKNLIANWNVRGREGQNARYSYHIEYPKEADEYKYYQVSCYSDCGSYFMSYLKHVTVKALNPDHAKDVVQAWCVETGNSFIKPRGKWRVEELKQDQKCPLVIDWHSDSDY